MKKIILGCVMLICMMTGCTKEEAAPASSPLPTLVAYINNDKQLTLFKEAFYRSGLDKDAVILNGGPFSVFAPIDSAFEAAGLDLNAIRNTEPARLSAILRYHILPGRINGETMIGFFSIDLTSLHATAKPRVCRNYEGLFIDGMPVAVANVAIGDGVLHKIKGVCHVPDRTLLELIRSRSDLSMLAHCLKKFPEMETLLADPDYQDTWQFVLGRGMTLFAPDNIAFAANGFPEEADFDALESDMQKSVLSRLLIGGKRFLPDMIGGLVIGIHIGPEQAVPNLVRPGARPSYILEKGARKFRTTGNLIAPRIKQPNIGGVNGVIHIIDQIILP
ncbi:fasciclin domain-containing protein [Chitinophaga pendula]|uniref:fasciclin domain-containing protein n=1 Tax=Chitinophaga TaxID=79328 RepID=UPI000BAEA12D|nr:MULTISPECIES: fasciclin domain-containing protein [Chitinophaga]ASZ12149.1 hypothetical protein CK934_14865 [Chitinophaga sp. MD30]UCJ04811.1 fasciclin domain-containing protein [Chitinophaga pendula]